MRRNWMYVFIPLVVAIFLLAFGEEPAIIQAVVTAILVAITAIYVNLTGKIAEQAIENNKLATTSIDKSSELNKISTKALNEAIKSNINNNAPELQVVLTLEKIILKRYDSSRRAFSEGETLGNKLMQVNDHDRITLELKIELKNIGRSTAIINFAENIPLYLVQHSGWEERGLLPLSLGPGQNITWDFRVSETIDGWRQRESLPSEKQQFNFRGINYRDSFCQIQDNVEIKVFIKPIVFKGDGLIELNHDLPFNTGGAVLKRTYPGIN